MSVSRLVVRPLLLAEAPDRLMYGSTRFMFGARIEIVERPGLKPGE